MHLDNLRGMPDGETRIEATETFTFLLEKCFVADEDDVDIDLFESLEGTLNTRGRPMVPPDGIKRNDRTSLCTHGWRRKDWVNTGCPLALTEKLGRALRTRHGFACRENIPITTQRKHRYVSR